MTKAAAVRISTQEYLTGLRAALDDLPAPEVAEILDDAGTHLAELQAELGEVDLTERLGTPQSYAAELRAAAGYPPAPASTGASTVAARLALTALVGSTALVLLVLPFYDGFAPGLVVLAVALPFLALPVVVHGGPRMEAVAALPSVRRLLASAPDPDSTAGRAVGFVASLQPAWWLVRAGVAALLVSAVFGVGGSATVVLGVLFAPVSVWLGFRSRRDRRLLWAVVPLNALAVVVVVAGPVDVGAYAAPTPAYSPPAPYYEGLWQDGERQIEDIVPVDAQGTPLTGIYLRDQDGQPIDAVPSCYEAYGFPAGVLPGAPYPRGTAVYDERTGECVRIPSVPLAGPVFTTPTDQAPPTR